MDIAITQETRGEIERIQREFQNLLSESEILKGTAQGINGVLSRSISRINKQIKSEYNITQKYLSRQAVVYPKAYSSRLYGGIKINYSPVPVIAFKPKQSQRNIVISIRKGKTVVIKNSFIKTMGSGHEGVFSPGRYAKGRGFIPEIAKTGSGKVRITEIKTASPFTMGTTKSVAEDVQAFMGSEILARVEGMLKVKVNRLAANNK